MEDDLRQARVRAWVATYIPSTFKSARQWAVRANLSENVVNNVQTSGRAEMQTIAKMARAVDENPVSALVRFGFLGQEELEGYSPESPAWPRGS